MHRRWKRPAASTSPELRDRAKQKGPQRPDSARQRPDSAQTAPRQRPEETESYLEKIKKRKILFFFFIFPNMTLSPLGAVWALSGRCRALSGRCWLSCCEFRWPGTLRNTQRAQGRDWTNLQPPRFTFLCDFWKVAACVKPPQSLSGRVLRPCRASPRPCAPFCVRPRGGCAGHPLGRSVPSALRVLRLWAPRPLARASLGPCVPFCVRPRGGCAGHPLGRSVPSAPGLPLRPASLSASAREAGAQGTRWDAQCRQGVASCALKIVSCKNEKHLFF